MPTFIGKDHILPFNSLFLPESLKKYVVITGHYGSGKTNFTLQLAHDLAHAGKRVAVVDLDIVNPYFRSSDYIRSLEADKITVVAPNFARTALDTPSLSAQVYAVFEESFPADYVLFDVGGDDAGATALGRYLKYFDRIDYQMIGVINYFRNLTQTPDETCEVLHEIEQACSLHMSALVNNSHLYKETEMSNVVRGYAYAQEVSEMCNLPLLCTTVPFSLVSRASDVENVPLENAVLYPVKIHVQTPWDEDSSILGG